MTFFSDEPSRADVVAQVTAAFAKPVTWSSLAEIARELVALTPRLDPAAVPSPPGLRERLLAQSPPPSNPPQTAARHRAGLRTMVLLLDVATDGAPAAVDHCLAELTATPDGPALLQAMTPFLDATGLARDLASDQIERIVTQRLPLDGSRIAFALSAVILLGLSRTATADARRRAFEGAAAPYMRAVALAGSADALLVAEGQVYENYLKAIETPEHHTETFAVIEGAYAGLPAEPAPAPAAARDDHPPRIAFLIPHGQMLAHTEVLLSFLTGLRKLEAPPIEPIVLMYAEAEGRELGSKLDGLGVRWEATALPGGLEARYRQLRERCVALEVEAAIIVSLPLHLAYFCRRPVASVQVWWSMKFALPNFAVDGRVFYRSLLDQKIEIAGRTWRGGPLAFTAPPAPDPAAVAAIRARYPGMKILGTIAREEKIANAEYLEAVVAVLRRHPDACFLWTGRTRLPEVQAAFDRAGVADRCHFLGWVDPAPHIAAFDLFLETYPLTGLMCGWAMAFGKPVLSVGPLGFLGSYLQPLFDGTIASDPEAIAGIRQIFAPIADRLPGIWAAAPSDIPAFADALLADPALAADLGAAQQRYVETFMADEAASAATQARHFADIVREARAAR